MAIAPRISRAGLVVLDPSGQSIDAVITLQYNPESVTRSIQARGSSGEGGEISRVTGTATQTISMDAELDATEQLSLPVPAAVEVADGLHPYLAALEGLLNPTVESVLENDRIAAEGFLEVIPMASPGLVLVWSRQRVVPVRLTELSIVEEAFDTQLNPIRAKVSFGFTVLGVNELGTASRSGALAVGHHRKLESLADARGFGTLADLGSGVVL